MRHDDDVVEISIDGLPADGLLVDGLLAIDD
jgi:hypothetical protein